MAVVRSGLALTGIGIAIGVMVALVAAPVISRFLFEIRISSPATVVLAAGILLVVATAASAIPALRAARLEPRAVLAEE
jgi:ABC-type antimicrobial peptide transport system permease subunit